MKIESNCKYVVYALTNTINGKQYIGLTTNFEMRINNHKNPSNNPKTTITKAINKFKWENFIYDILLKTNNINKAGRMEKHFILTMDTSNPNGYNIDLGGIRGHYHSEETKQKISASQKGTSKPWGREVGMRYRKHYTVISPTGEIIPVYGIAAFARENNLNHRHLIEVAQGKASQHKGWRCTYVD